MNAIDHGETTIERQEDRLLRGLHRDPEHTLILYVALIGACEQ